MPAAEQIICTNSVALPRRDEESTISCTIPERQAVHLHNMAYIAIETRNFYPNTVHEVS